MCANFLLLFIYDNYYLVKVENDYLMESRDTLREYALGLRHYLSKGNGDTEVLTSRWALDNNIPVQLSEISKLSTSVDVISELQRSDYVIDLYASHGPSAFVKISETKAAEIGPLDVLEMESTSFQPMFILLSILVNGCVAFIGYLLFKRQLNRVEMAEKQILQHKTLSEDLLIGQDILSGAVKYLLQLDEHIKKIEQSNQAIIVDQKDMMHAVAHELRSPIARISFALELISDSTENDSQEFLQQIYESIEELESLISEILSYSRLAHAGMDVFWNEIDLCAVAESVLDKISPLYSEKEFRFECQNSTLLLTGEERLIERVFMNLLRNAARFAKQKVDLRICQQQGNLLIQVDDDGIGIPPGKRNRIFEPFTRLDPSRSRDSGGVGLGLAIVKKVVEKHNGSVTVSESPTGGARFEVTLPVTQLH